MKYCLLVCLILFTVLSCADLVEQGNLFEKLEERPSTDLVIDKHVNDSGTVDTNKAETFVNDIQASASKKKFFRDLNDKSREKANKALTSVYTNKKVDEKTRQKAAIIAAQVQLKGNKAGETINNVASVLVDKEKKDALNKPKDLVSAVIPKETREKPEEVKKLLRASLEAAKAFEVVGSTLETATPAETPAPAETTEEPEKEVKKLPADVNAGEVAQQAAVAIVLKQTADTNGDNMVSEEELEEFTQAIVQDKYDKYQSAPLTKAVGTKAKPTPLRNILKSANLLELFERVGK